MKVLLVIDCEVSFINEYTKPYIKKIENLIKSNQYDEVVFTQYYNHLTSPFFKELYYTGCMKENEQKIVIDTKGYKVIKKDTYTAYTDELKNYIEKNKIQEIALCGFDTDACVLKTALDLFEDKKKVKVLAKYCMSCKGKRQHKRAIIILKRLIGKKNII